MLEKIEKIHALLNVPNVDADTETAITNMKILNLLVDLRAEAEQLTISGVVSSAKNKDAIISEMKKMTDDERLDIITEFCKYCGDLDSSCQCWNDE